jgi:flagellar P-ring protein precursor FlgI
VGGISETSSQGSFQKNQTTVGRIPNGAIVEVEVPVTFEDQHNITIVLNDTNFITVSRAAKTIADKGFPGAKAVDANTIKIPLADLQSEDLVETIAQLQNIQITPDSSSKIVMNTRTGTIVIGEMVKLFPVALTHGNISVKISNDKGNNVETPQPVVVDEAAAKIILLNPSETLTGLVNALNEIGATTKDLISIMQALKESGALVGQLELI